MGGRLVEFKLGLLYQGQGIYGKAEYIVWEARQILHPDKRVKFIASNFTHVCSNVTLNSMVFHNFLHFSFKKISQE